MIRFRDFTYESMMDEAAMRAALGEEMCGLLVRWTSDRLVSDPFILYARAENVAEFKHNTYCVDHETHLWYAKSETFDIIGVVHSHLNGSVTPSRIDQDGMDPSLIYAIIDTKMKQMSCWQLHLDDSKASSGEGWRVTPWETKQLPWQIN